MPLLGCRRPWIGRVFAPFVQGSRLVWPPHSGGGGANVIMAMRQQFSYIGADVIGRTCMSGRDKEANPETIDEMIDNLAR